jgi:hypothetical protein
MIIKMKLLIYSLMIALAAQQCQQDKDEEYDVVRTQDEEGFVAEDIIRREAAAKWDDFLSHSYKYLDKAEKEIEEATNHVGEPGTKNRLLLEMEIIRAESMLEQLCEKLERGSRFNGIDLTDENISRMNHYMADYLEKEENLKKVLDGLKNEKFKK